MNQPLTHQQLKELDKGFHPTLYPNRKQRRAFKQKINNRPNMSAIDHIQYALDTTGRVKRIYHYKDVLGLGTSETVDGIQNHKPE
jgi:hypothetical protein